ncbi:hypothetical protein MUK42_30885 [Musa troglodytarum]|uniref:Uncharacterized protein n=1 Tax=Musa troglodytarum TaxID=320322 RepID=A0A9E7FJU7_9LILI|nr:hypothetical protein MUK42_30885 [Musa troglodytarum]
MSGLVGIWMGGMARLGRKRQSAPSCSLARHEEEEGKMRGELRSGEEEAAQVKARRNSGVALSETTLCLLMDRFAPA